MMFIRRLKATMPKIDRILKKPAQSVALFAHKHLNLRKARLADEYFYSCLPLCVLDAVFSIGVKYKSVQNTVQRYCSFFGLEEFRRSRNELLPVESQLSISEFVRQFDSCGMRAFTEGIFDNRQRTSPRNGILKAEAVLSFARALEDFRIQYLQNMPRVIDDGRFSKSILSIPGQRSGVSLQYFFMLAGSDHLIKPDRMILRFIQNRIGRTVTPKEAEAILTKAVGLLQEDYPQMTPRLLDYLIWDYQHKQR